MTGRRQTFQVPVDKAFAARTGRFLQMYQVPEYVKPWVSFTVGEVQSLLGWVTSVYFSPLPCFTLAQRGLPRR